MKVTTYAPPFRPPFFRSLENLYSFDPYILAKMRKKSYFDPYFSSKLGKMYSFDPPFFTLVAFRVDGRCWASLSETEPSTPPPPGWIPAWIRSNIHHKEWDEITYPFLNLNGARIFISHFTGHVIIYTITPHCFMHYNYNLYKTDAERRQTLGHPRSINPNMINHVPQQSPLIF